MARSSKKVIYISLGMLVVFACIPFARLLEPTPAPVTTAPPLETSTEVRLGQAPAEVLTATPGYKIGRASCRERV